MTHYGYLLDMRLKLFTCSLFILLITSCSQNNNHSLPVVGELEWERIELINELSEPIIARHAAEGDELEAGALILSLDARRTSANLQALKANRNQLASKLQELIAGSRIEDIEQAKKALQVADQHVQSDEITLQHLQIRTPRAGRLDSLPFEIGEQPPVGSTVAVMLGGKQPYARIHIPEQIRAWISSATSL